MAGGLPLIPSCRPRQNQLILRILRDEPVTAVEWAVSLGAGLALVAVAWLVAARLYYREQLATSG